MTTITGCWGAGANHLRLLLGLRPGGEIRDLRGQPVPDHRKERVCLDQLYHPARASTAPSRPQWSGAQSYWLRMEFLTRELYTDIQISHDRALRPAGPWVRLRVSASRRVRDLYWAKCPDLNGFTPEALLAKIDAWSQPVEGAVLLDTDSLFAADFTDRDLPRVCHDLGLPVPVGETARRVHERWCELNARLLHDRGFHGR